MSLLSIIQNLCGELALASPNAAVGSSDRQVLQLVALANRAGLKLAERFNWQAIRVELDFSTLAQQQQNGFMPADFDRFVPNSFFNRTTRRPLTGPLTVRQHQWIQAQPVYSTVYQAFIMRGNQMLFDPNPAAANLVACEYISKNWVIGAGPTPQSRFLADGDTALLDEDLITLGTLWRFLRRKGLDYAEEMSDYEEALEVKMARDGSATALSLAPQPVDLNRTNIPDGNFGV